MEKANLKGLHANVYGRVQGVGFRYSTVIQVRNKKISGYVRNRMDGSVEVLAEGEEKDLKSLLVWLKKGPPGSYVNKVDHHYTAYTGVYRHFGVEY